MATRRPAAVRCKRMLGVSVSTVCINNLECGVIGNVGKPLRNSACHLANASPSANSGHS